MHHVIKILFIVIAVVSTPAYAVTFKHLASQYLNNGLLSDQVQIIDCRSSNQYNGWPLPDGHSGGHFPGAINLDSQWLSLLDTAQLSKLISAKQLHKNKPTFLYCNANATLALTQALQQQGFDNITAINEPLSQAEVTLISLPNFKQLVSPQWLDAVVNDKSTLYAPAKDYRLIEVNWGPAVKYLAAHIPGALYLDTQDLETLPWWNRVSDKQLAKLLKKLGIRFDTTVILYGRNNIAAARAANIMMYAGVADVRLLNGGWQAWSNAGLATESFFNSNTEQLEFGKQIPANPHYIIDVPQAKALLAKDPQQHSLVSIRTWDEFTGKISGYNYIKEKGRIVGAKWGHAGSNSNNVDDFLNPDGTMKSARDIQRLWQDEGINATQEVAFYCGTGWRAAQVFFYSYVMGWKNISVFDGGWYEWSADKSNPTATGAITATKVPQ